MVSCGVRVWVSMCVHDVPSKHLAATFALTNPNPNPKPNRNPTPDPNPDPDPDPNPNLAAIFALHCCSSMSNCSIRALVVVVVVVVMAILV